MSALSYDDLEASQERFCPFCDEPLRPHRAANKVNVDVCSECGATWFDKNELRRSRMHLGLPARSEKRLLERISWQRGTLHCPRCDVRILRVGKVSGHRIAHCPECHGFLVDDEDVLEAEDLMLHPPELREVDRSKILNRPKYPVSWLVAVGYVAFLAILGLVWFLRNA